MPLRVRYLVQGHMDGKWQALDVTPRLSESSHRGQLPPPTEAIPELLPNRHLLFSVVLQISWSLQLHKGRDGFGIPVIHIWELLVGVTDVLSYLLFFFFYKLNFDYLLIYKYVTYINVSMWSAQAGVNLSHLFICSSFLFSPINKRTINTAAMNFFKHTSFCTFRINFQMLELLGDVLF